MENQTPLPKSVARFAPWTWTSRDVVVMILTVVALASAPSAYFAFDYYRPLTPRDHADIVTLVEEITDEPVLRISPDGPSQVEVWTGVVRGPEVGGGCVYWFRRSWGRWKRIREDSSGGWVI